MSHLQIDDGFKFGNWTNYYNIGKNTSNENDVLIGSIGSLPGTLALDSLWVTLVDLPSSVCLSSASYWNRWSRCHKIMHWWFVNKHVKGKPGTILSHISSWIGLVNIIHIFFLAWLQEHWYCLIYANLTRVNWVIFASSKFRKTDSLLHICEVMNKQVAVLFCISINC